MLDGGIVSIRIAIEPRKVLSNEDGLKAEAIGKACDNATQQKKVIEERLGLKLTAKGLSHPSAEMLHPMRAGVQGGTAPSFIGGVLTDPSYRVTVNALKQEHEGESAFGELKFQAQVRVEYSAENK